MSLRKNSSYFPHFLHVTSHLITLNVQVRQRLCATLSFTVNLIVKSLISEPNQNKFNISRTSRPMSVAVLVSLLKVFFLLQLNPSRIRGTRSLKCVYADLFNKNLDSCRHTDNITTSHGYFRQDF